MGVALVLFGAVFGFLAGVSALIAGASVWTAVLLYSGIGIATVLTLAIGLVLRSVLQGSAHDEKGFAMADAQRG